MHRLSLCRWWYRSDVGMPVEVTWVMVAVLRAEVVVYRGMHRSDNGGAGTNYRGRGWWSQCSF